MQRLADPGRLTAEELMRRLDANPRFRRAQGNPDEVTITFVQRRR